MDSQPALDFLSDLPLSIIESILTLLPTRDAVRTSILSRKWRYRWASIPQLIFDDKCVKSLPDKVVTETRLVKFITQTILLHNGPIYKFKLCTSLLHNCVDIDQWLLFLSRTDVKEISLELGCEGDWFRVPSCMFRCRRLTVLELCRCELDPPPDFGGFSFLRTLNLYQVLVTPDDLECLISSCHLLENLTFSYYEGLDLTINAPNLKCLTLEGEFKELYLENTPLLEVVSITLYTNFDDVLDHFEQSSGCTFAKFLGSVPKLKRLIGHVYFTKYLSIGIDQWKPPLCCTHLKFIELYQVSFEDMKEIQVVLLLITNSPNLQELQISGSSSTVMGMEASDLDFWEIEYPSDCTFKQLKSVRLKDLCGVRHEMQLIKFLLGNSPALEIITIAPCIYTAVLKLDMLIELVRFRRASPIAEIQFLPGEDRIPVFSDQD